MKKFYSLFLLMLFAIVGAGQAWATDYPSNKSVDISLLEIGDYVHNGTILQTSGEAELYFYLNYDDYSYEYTMAIESGSYVVGSATSDSYGISFGDYFITYNKFEVSDAMEYAGLYMIELKPVSSSDNQNQDPKPTNYPVDIVGDGHDGYFYGTFYANQNVVIPVGYTAYAVESVEHGIVELNGFVSGGDFRGGVLKANTPVIIKGTTEGRITLEVTSQSGTNTSDRYLRGSLVNGTDNEDGYYFYKLSYDSEGTRLGFYWEAGTSGTSISTRPNKAYLAIPKDDAPSSNALSFRFEDTITGIMEFKTQSEERIYNLQGQVVKGNVAGVYVKNGKKYIVK